MTKAKKKTNRVRKGAILGWTHAEEGIFLDALARGGTVTRAVTTIGRLRDTAYKRRDKLPAFAARWAEAVEAGTDRLEDKAYDLAVDGVETFELYQGCPVPDPAKKGQHLKRTLYIPSLTQFMLKARRPEKFADKQQLQITGAQGGPIEVTVKELSTEERLALRMAAAKVIEHDETSSESG